MAPLSMDDMLLNIIIWRDCLSRAHYASALTREMDRVIKRVEHLLDNSPAFLRPQCGWALENAFTLSASLADIAGALNGLSGNVCGVQLAVNDKLVVRGPARPFHDIRVYIGLEKAEATPVVGMRHRSKRRALAVQLSERNLDFREPEAGLAAALGAATPIHLTHESLTHVRNRFYRFRFADLRVPCDFNQYQVTRPLYQLAFVSLNKMCVMPYCMLDCLVDLLMNARAYSAPYSTIRASLFNADGNFYMIVSDSGQGMAEERADVVFGRPWPEVHGAHASGEFGSAESSGASARPQAPAGPRRLTRAFGNGTGLAKLKLVVGLYGGVVNVSAVDGGGTRIIIKLPMEGDLEKYSARGDGVT